MSLMCSRTPWRWFLVKRSSTLLARRKRSILLIAIAAPAVPIAILRMNLLRDGPLSLIADKPCSSFGSDFDIILLLHNCLRTPQPRLLLGLVRDPVIGGRISPNSILRKPCPHDA